MNLEEFIKLQKKSLRDSMGKLYREETFGTGIELLMRETARVAFEAIGTANKPPSDSAWAGGWNSALAEVNRKAKSFLGDEPIETQKKGGF